MTEPKKNAPAYQSFMTAPEWKNVEISEDLAHFLEKKHALYHFMFLREAYETNRIFYHTLRTSLKHNTLQQLIYPEEGYYNYLMMDLFVVVMTNLSMISSKLYCIMIQLMMFTQTLQSMFNDDAIKNDTPFQQIATNYYFNFVKKLNIMPFYNVDYEEALATLRKEYNDCIDRTWTDYWTYFYIVLEIQSKICLSQWMKSDFAEPDLTCAQVSYDGEQAFETCFSNAKSAFLKDLDNIPGDFSNKPQDQIDIIDADKKLISTPRYMDFRRAIHHLGQEGIKIETLAGQKRVQVKVTGPTGHSPKLTPDDKVSYTYPNIVDRRETFFMLDMATEDLNRRLEVIEGDEGFNVKFVHNF